MRDDSDPLSTFEFRRSRSDRSPGRELLDLYNTQYAGRAARPGPVTPEDTARELGYERARLDSDPAQQHSRRLVAGSGYVEIGRYNTNRISDYFAEKRL